MSNLHLRIATLEKTIFDEEVTAVTLPGEAGEFGVLPNHAPLITPLVLGEIVAKKEGEDFYMTVSGGMVEVRPDHVLVLADQAERAEEIDEKLAEEARARAEEVMKDKQVDGESFAAAEAELQRSLLRIKVVRKHRSRRGATAVSH